MNGKLWLNSDILRTFVIYFVFSIPPIFAFPRLSGEFFCSDHKDTKNYPIDNQYIIFSLIIYDYPYLETCSPYLLFGYALQLCEVIIWFGNYAKSHNDREANLAKCKVVKKETGSILEQKPAIEEYEGKTFLLEQDEKGNLHCGYCLVSFKQNQDKIGRMVLLKNVVENKNSGELKKMYPLYASRIEVVE